nr:putative ribonuclease H-like domain-containing protein [Tanacetum cinerariifolium]
MNVKSAFLYGTIEEEVYVYQPPGFEDPDHPDKVYKVVKALYGLHQALRAWYETLATYLLENGKSASTPIDTEMPLLKDPDGEDVDVHTYRSMIGSLMYLTSSRPDIMFAVQDVAADTAAQGADTAAIGDVQHTPPQSPQPQPQSPPQAQPQATDFLMSLLQEALDACAALTRRVEHLKHDKVAQALETTKIKRRRIDTLDDTVMEDASNKGRMIDALDSDAGVALMDDKEEEKKVKEAMVVGDDQVKGRQAEIYQIDMDHASKVLSIQEDEPEVQEVVDVVTTAKLITKVVTAASESVTAASTTIAAVELQVTATTITAALVRVATAFTRRRKGVVIRDPGEESTTIISVDTKSKDKGKGIMVEEPKPLKKKQHVEMDEEYARKLHEELKKDIDWDVAIDHLKEQPEEEENRAIESINKTPAKKEAKRRKLNEEVEDLKRHLEIVPDEDDGVYTEATPLVRKVPVVDYEIIHLNNNPHYKIIRADGTHQLFGVDAVMDLEEKHLVLNAAGE